MLIVEEVVRHDAEEVIEQADDTRDIVSSFWPYCLSPSCSSSLSRVARLCVTSLNTLPGLQGSRENELNSFSNRSWLGEGLAFITFRHQEDAARAIANVNGFDYNSRILSVQWANETFPTHTAGIWPVPRMQFLVLQKPRFHSKAFLTNAADMRSFARVEPHVPRQKASVKKPHWT
ncbi:hypothetical protein HPB48_017645 [Haemaphysalis longicornis]|uniref:RRM domain-containing protein n=1 Tax=Haemaphysalis longicornis TaxID=44386 RepID=A0A9J6FD27_HAELO|nr:hypothetical protein HPB48_017645 [Haemaphysalis longicornis]